MCLGKKQLDFSESDESEERDWVWVWGEKQQKFFESVAGGSETEERESSLKQIARLEGVASVLKTLEKYPTILPMSFITRKITKETRKKDPNEFIKSSKFSLFNQIIDKINDAKENYYLYRYDINGYKIMFLAYHYLKDLLLSTKDLYRYILEGYFSQNDDERFQRVVTYLDLLITWWEHTIESAQDWLSHDADRGDGWMMDEEELMYFVKDILEGESCHFNIEKIIEEEDYKDQDFVKFMSRYFTKEAKQALDTRIERKLGLEQEFPTNQD